MSIKKSFAVGINNIIIHREGDELYKNRKGYYEALLEIWGKDLEKELETGKPIIIAEEGEGAGIYCDGEGRDKDGRPLPINDKYDDRMTVILKNNKDEIEIHEFYRANVDTSIKFPSVRSGKNKPIEADEYDFIVGDHRGKYKALNIFDSRRIEDIKDKDTRIKMETEYKNNSLKYTDVKKNLEIRTVRSINSGSQRWINEHEGYKSYTYSKGCLTIISYDYPEFIKLLTTNSLGKLYLFR